VRFQLEAKEIIQAPREVVQLEMELKWVKFRALQVEKNLFSLSMNTMVEAIKVLQTLVVSERETNLQLSLELKKVQKEKGIEPNRKTAKAMKTQTPNPFMGKDTKAKIVKQWAL
jgi:hypothetical protein